MGNKLTRRSGNSDQHTFVKATGLYPKCEWDDRTVKKLIHKKKIAPRYPGREEQAPDFDECPICFLWYPGGLNRSKCCKQPICTECFLQFKKPTSLKPIQCPFCNAHNYTVKYSGVKTKEEREEIEQEEQRVIEAKIRMRKEELENDAIREAELAEQKERRIREGPPEPYPAPIPPSSTAAASVEFIAKERQRRRSSGGGRSSRQLTPPEPAEESDRASSEAGEEGEIPNDVEELMVMEAIRLSLLDDRGQEGQGEDEERDDDTEAGPARGQVGYNDEGGQRRRRMSEEEDWPAVTWGEEGGLLRSETVAQMQNTQQVNAFDAQVQAVTADMEKDSALFELLLYSVEFFSYPGAASTQEHSLDRCPRTPLLEVSSSLGTEPASTLSSQSTSTYAVIGARSEVGQDDDEICGTEGVEHTSIRLKLDENDQEDVVPGNMLVQGIQPHVPSVFAKMLMENGGKEGEKRQGIDSTEDKREDFPCKHGDTCSEHSDVEKQDMSREDAGNAQRKIQALVDSKEAAKAAESNDSEAAGEGLDVLTGRGEGDGSVHGGSGQKPKSALKYEIFVEAEHMTDARRDNDESSRLLGHPNSARNSPAPVGQHPHTRDSAAKVGGGGAARHRNQETDSQVQDMHSHVGRDRPGLDFKALDDAGGLSPEIGWSFSNDFASPFHDFVMYSEQQTEKKHPSMSPMLSNAEEEFDGPGADAMASSQSGSQKRLILYGGSRNGGEDRRMSMYSTQMKSEGDLGEKMFSLIGGEGKPEGWSGRRSLIGEEGDSEWGEDEEELSMLRSQRMPDVRLDGRMSDGEGSDDALVVHMANKAGDLIEREEQDVSTNERQDERKFAWGDSCVKDEGDRVCIDNAPADSLMGSRFSDIAPAERDCHTDFSQAALGDTAPASNAGPHSANMALGAAILGAVSVDGGVDDEHLNHGAASGGDEREDDGGTQPEIEQERDDTSPENSTESEESILAGAPQWEAVAGDDDFDVDEAETQYNSGEAPPSGAHMED